MEELIVKTRQQQMLSRRVVSAAEELARRELASTNYLDFIKYVWWMPGPLMIGLHTRIMAARIDQAIIDYCNGKDTFLCIKVPFRHGKSDMFSRALPPYIVGRLAAYQPSLFLTAYGSSLVSKLSRKSRQILASKAYQRVFPNVRLSPRKRTDALWTVDYKNEETGEWEQSTGETCTAGFTGSITGSGYAVGIIDDFFKKRQEAESPTQRERVWDTIVNEFLTRRDPVSINIITATPWHMDDPFGRVKQAMKNDPTFPRFEFMSFPARGPAIVKGRRIKYKSKYLFPERFSNAWYEGHYAALKGYAAAGLLDCSPTVLKGNLLDVSRIKVHTTDKSFPKCRYIRFWDLASTKKQVAKNDPDYTVGTLLGITTKIVGEAEIDYLWIKDVVFGQWAAPERDRIIQATAIEDGPGVYQVQESVGGHKDTPARLKEILAGCRIVREWYPQGSGDKVTRAEALMPIFESGNVNLLMNGIKTVDGKNSWIDRWVRQFREFPNGDHDDFIDSTTGGYWYIKKSELIWPISRNKLGV